MQSAEGVIEAGTILVGKYRIESVLGRGGMGMVYRAHHLSLDETVAIKVLRRDVSLDEETVHRFVREAQSAVKLKSEHVARIRDVGTFDDDLPYMVMEFLEGADLGQLVDTNGAMNVPIAVDLVLQACDAIAEAHSLGIVHRDIKPSNLFVSFRPDDTAIVKVLDFGISKSATGADLSLTQTSSVLGTPAYMSPEQMRSARTVDARSDIWSLGTVLYELVEARRPFNAESFSEMCVMVAVDPPSPLQLAPELEAVIMRCLAKNPEQRYANVPDLMRDLAAFAGNPDAARHFVTRAYRVLGLPVPRSFESSPSIRPVATYQSPVPAMPLSAIMPTRTASPTVSTTIAGPAAKSRSSFVVVLLLCLLLGVGGAVTYVKLTGDDAIAAVDAPSAAGGAGSGSNALAGSAADPGSGSNALTGSAADPASDSVAGAGSGSNALAGSAADPGSGSVTESGLVVDSGSDSVAGAGSGSVTGSGSASASGSGSGSVAGAGSARAGSPGSATVSNARGKPPRGNRPPKGGKPPKGGAGASGDAGKGSGSVVEPKPKPKCDPFNSVRDGC